MDEQEKQHLLNSFSAWMTIDSFLDSMRLRNCSPQTIKEYRKSIVAYMLTTRNFSLDATPADIRAWLGGCYDRNLKPGTIQTRLTHLRSMWKFAVDEGLADDNPAARIQNVKLPKRLPKSLTQEQVRQFMDVVQANDTERGKRDYVLFRLMYACGLRIAEIVSLRVEGCGGNFVQVIGKGNKQRKVFLNSDVATMLGNWIGEKESGWVFPGRGTEHLSARVIQHYTRLYGHKAGLGRVHPHVFRHSCATHSLLAGAPITHVQAQLGHEKLSTTGLYTQLVDSDRARFAEETMLAL